MHIGTNVVGPSLVASFTSLPGLVTLAACCHVARGDVVTLKLQESSNGCMSGAGGLQSASGLAATAPGEGHHPILSITPIHNPHGYSKL